MAARLIALAFVALLATACGIAREAKPKSDITLSQLRRPSAPATYYLGDRFESIPLTGIVGGLRRTTFVYGTCKVQPGQGGCTPPLEIQHWFLRERPPWKFPAAISCRLVRVGGAPAVAFASAGGLEVYLGSRVVVVFGRTPAAMRRAALALHPVKPGSGPLPAPPARVLRYVSRRCT
jgi:hypothetical protein